MMRITRKNEIITYSHNDLLITFENPDNLYFKHHCGDVQRLLNSEHLQELINYQESYYKKYNEYSFPNPIIFCKLEDKYAILDGQHRYETIKYLSKTYKDRSMTIMISCIQISSEDEYIELFKAVNKNMPLPPMIQNNTDTWIRIGKKIHTYFMDTYGCYHKNSENCY